MTQHSEGTPSAPESQEMTLIEHLLELRSRLLKMVLAVKQLVFQLLINFL